MLTPAYSFMVFSIPRGTSDSAQIPPHCDPERERGLVEPGACVLPQAGARHAVVLVLREVHRGPRDLLLLPEEKTGPIRKRRPLHAFLLYSFTCPYLFRRTLR